MTKIKRQTQKQKLDEAFKYHIGEYFAVTKESKAQMHADILEIFRQNMKGELGLSIDNTYRYIGHRMRLLSSENKTLREGYQSWKKRAEKKRDECNAIKNQLRDLKIESNGWRDVFLHEKEMRITEASFHRKEFCDIKCTWWFKLFGRKFR